MIRQDLVDAYIHIKKVNKLSYSKMQELTQLTKSQLILILCQSGEGISVDKMIDGLIMLGYKVSIIVVDSDGNTIKNLV